MGVGFGLVGFNFEFFGPDLRLDRGLDLGLIGRDCGIDLGLDVGLAGLVLGLVGH